MPLHVIFHVKSLKISHCIGVGHELSEAGEGNKTRIAMKFGMLVIGLDENAVSIDELAHIFFWGGGWLPRAPAMDVSCSLHAQLPRWNCTASPSL